MTKTPAKGGLGIGTIGSSLVLFIILGSLIIYTVKKGSLTLATSVEDS